MSLSSSRKFCKDPLSRYWTLPPEDVLQPGLLHLGISKSGKNVLLAANAALMHLKTVTDLPSKVSEIFFFLPGCFALNYMHFSNVKSVFTDGIICLSSEC